MIRNQFSTSLNRLWHFILRIACCFLAALVAQSTPGGAIGKSAGKSDGPALSQPLTIAWRYHTDQTTDLTPAADAQTVFFPLSNGVLLALNATDGKLVWRAEVGGDFSALLADDRSVYAATSYSERDQKTIHGGTQKTGRRIAASKQRIKRAYACVEIQNHECQKSPCEPARPTAWSSSKHPKAPN